MAKLGLTPHQAKNLLRERSVAGGWALCVGSGISRPVFPDWGQLVEQLIARDVAPSDVSDVSSLSYGPDAFIQAAMDRLHLDEAAFIELLVAELYAGARSLLTPSHWSIFARALNTRHLGGLRRDQWADFLGVTSAAFPDLPSLGLAQTIGDVLRTEQSPSAILSFNAEPLLGALINGSVATRSGRPDMRDVMDYVTHATSNRQRARVPYIFCHGLLPVPDAGGRPPLSSADKLVFTEGSYLQLANNSFSWQSASFIQAAASHSLVFIGVSLTDPNMRRWLSWVHSSRVAELTEVGATSPTSTVHYWIRRRPPEAHTQRWLESLVAHLGVRVVWVADYADVVPAFRGMLGV